MSGHRQTQLSSKRGCYRCGKWVWKFGGFVSPAIIDFLTGLCVPQVARWWTDCEDCGYVEVNE